MSAEPIQLAFTGFEVAPRPVLELVKEAPAPPTVLEPDLGALVPDTPEDRRFLRRVLSTYLHYFGGGSGYDAPVAAWANATRDRLNGPSNPKPRKPKAAKPKKPKERKP